MRKQARIRVTELHDSGFAINSIIAGREVTVSSQGAKGATKERRRIRKIEQRGGTKGSS